MLDHLQLVAPPVAAALAAVPAEVAATVRVAAIDPDLADTAAFCERYGVAPEQWANCVVVIGKRAGDVRFAALAVLATTRADVNGQVRRLLDVRKCSFAPIDEAVGLTGMEYGGIADRAARALAGLRRTDRVAEATEVVVGAGIRGAKLWLPGSALLTLPGAQVVADLAR